MPACFLLFSSHLHQFLTNNLVPKPRRAFGVLHLSSSLWANFPLCPCTSPSYPSPQTQIIRSLAALWAYWGLMAPVSVGNLEVWGMSCKFSWGLFSHFHSSPLCLPLLPPTPTHCPPTFREETFSYLSTAYSTSTHHNKTSVKGCPRLTISPKPSGPSHLFLATLWL